MTQFSTKHKGREQQFFIRSWADGLKQEVSPSSLPTTALTKCMNMMYYLDRAIDGSTVVKLRKRQGTQLISSSALGAEVKACTYYIADSHYIVATDSKLYELNSSTFAPEEIGTISGVPTFTEFHGKLIIHDGGITKAWNGTTFETLTCYYQDEEIESGNGSEVAFSGTLAHPVVKTSSLTITYTDSTTKTITDDGAGNLTGDCVSGTINYTTGEYSFTCTGAPDNTTTVYAAYEKVDGAPKSKAGFVRASRLYMWGDPDNPSRLWYSGPNDEDAWDTSSSGGYLDIDPLDGYSLVGCLNYFSVIVAMKGNSLHRVNSFPGETDFAVVPLMDNTGAMAYRACLNDGNMISFLSKQGWIGLTSTSSYGDVTKSNELSANFRQDAIKYCTSDCFAEYNQLDHQLWLTMYNGSAIHPYVYVINLDTGNQLSRYQFNFAHSCYKFVNGEMLIGGTDGNLYRLYGGTYQRYDDNAISYSANTFFRTVCTNWGINFNRKHNKKLFIHAYGASGMSATVNIYTDGDYYTPKLIETIDIGTDEVFIYDITTEIYDWSDLIAAERNSENNTSIARKFNYSEIMVEVTNIEGANGAEFGGIDFTGAIIGGRLNGDF